MSKVLTNLQTTTLTLASATLNNISLPTSIGSSGYLYEYNGSAGAFASRSKINTTTYTTAQTVTLPATYIHPKISIYGGSNGGYYLNVPVIAGGSFQITVIGSGTNTVTFTCPLGSVSLSATTSTT